MIHEWARANVAELKIIPADYCILSIRLDIKDLAQKIAQQKELQMVESSKDLALQPKSMLTNDNSLQVASLVTSQKSDY